MIWGDSLSVKPGHTTRTTRQFDGTMPQEMDVQEITRRKGESHSAYRQRKTFGILSGPLAFHDFRLKAYKMCPRAL